MKLEVGMYVRYISGFNNDKPIVRIGKVIEVSEYVIELDTFRSGVFSKSEFLKLCMVGKPSFDPIDLIEVGDVLIDKEGHKYPINYEFETDYNNEYGSYEITIDDNITLFFKDDLSIVTKEQFESMSHKV